MGIYVVKGEKEIFRRKEQFSIFLLAIPSIVDEEIALSLLQSGKGEWKDACVNEVAKIPQETIDRAWEWFSFSSKLNVCFSNSCLYCLDVQVVQQICISTWRL